MYARAARGGAGRVTDNVAELRTSDGSRDNSFASIFCDKSNDAFLAQRRGLQEEICLKNVRKITTYYDSIRTRD